MIEDRLNSSLSNLGYQRLDSNTQGIYLYYRTVEQDVIIISVVHVLNGDEITIEQYCHILEQMKDNFQKSFPYRIQLLSLVFTRFPDRVKHFCLDTSQDSHWIIDLSTSRVMIYETQLYDFAGLKGLIEGLLEDEQKQSDGTEPQNNRYGNPQNYGKRQPSIRSALPFTLFNTAIIIINIIAFILTHFILVFGTEDELFVKGALSWYFVTENKEYYRLITSMFMHADGSHLINNMIVLLFLGSKLEQAAGRLRYLFIYFGSGLLAGLASIGYNMWKANGSLTSGDFTFSIGASGAIFGVVGAIFYIVIINKDRLKEIGLRQIVIFIILSLYGGIINSQIDQAAHIGGFLAGLILAAIIYRNPKKQDTI